MSATHLGSLPGTDFAAALRLVRDSFPSIGVPELPARGVGAQMIGRTASLLDSLGAELQPSGWRLADHAGTDQRRARALLRRDLDDLEEQAHDFDGEIKLSVAGPWTLAAGIELPRGELVIADHGAARELGASLAQGIVDLLAELRRRFARAQWLVQLDEPSVGAVHDGTLRTASRYQRHRSVSGARIAVGWQGLSSAIRGAGAEVALHSCAGMIEVEWLRRAEISSVALDRSMLDEAALDELAGWIESGGNVWWGLQPTHVIDTGTGDQVLGRDALLAEFRRLVQRLGLDPVLVAERGRFTPACGLAGWSPASVRQVFANLAWLAEVAPGA